MSTSMPATDDPDGTVVARLRAAGRRMTSQRRVIAEAFDRRRRAAGDVHLTADQVLGMARETLPEISLATVYNTLNDMVGLGALSEISPDDGPKRYDANVAQEHHHLVCVDCSQVVDVRLDAAPAVPDSERRGFEVSEVAVTFRGRCAECRDQGGTG